MKFVVMDTEGSKAFVPIFSSTAIKVVTRMMTGSNHACAMTKRISMIITADMIITDTGGVAPSWLVSTTQLPPKRSLICLPKAF